MSKIIREYNITAREFAIKTNLGDTVCICGNHINGAYLAIPSLELSVELTDDGNIEDNTDRIFGALDDIRPANYKFKSVEHMKNFSSDIAEAVNPYITTEQTAEEYLKSIMSTGGVANEKG